MTLLALAFLGGILTILSPCILPVLPFVFSGADKSFRKHGIPLLGGLAATFVAVGAIAAISGGWAVRANQYGRIISLIAFGIFGLTLVWPATGNSISRPFVGIGNRVLQKTMGNPGPRQSFELGIATGLLWTPCAGPILGLILTGAALQGPSAQTLFLLLAYAAGAATSLAVALLAGSRVLQTLKKSLGAEAWIRRGLGFAVLLGVAATALGADRTVLARISIGSGSGLEQRVVDSLHLDRGAPIPATPSLAGAVTWLNSPSLNTSALKGKVVVVDFWTYSCINCLRSLPYLHAWADKYKDYGLQVVGVHTPEFSFERDVQNVKGAVHELNISYPVAVDNNYAIWGAFHNSGWPTIYFIDGDGHIRYRLPGEGEYKESEKIIQQLLKERGQASVPEGYVEVHAEGSEAGSNKQDVQSPEISLGDPTNISAAGPVQADGSKSYSLPANLKLNQWGLGGSWRVHGEEAILGSAPGTVIFRFHARDVHMVLGPGANGKPIRFHIKLDGADPGENAGTDINGQGQGTVVEHRLYQLIRQKQPGQDHTFEIEFIDSGVEAFTFAFG